MRIQRALAFISLLILLQIETNAQANLKNVNWRADIIRPDAKMIPFMLERRMASGKAQWYIVNGKERILMIVSKSHPDSIILQTPVFESTFRLRKVNADSLQGVWVSGTASGERSLPMQMVAAQQRFPRNHTAASKFSAAGNFEIEFTRPNQTKRKAIGVFEQKENTVTGSILTPSGDYRYLTGNLINDSLFLSTFDGSHAFLFEAAVTAEGLKGVFLSGAAGREPWVATRKATVEPHTLDLKPLNNIPLDFTFHDLDGNAVTLQDSRFSGKPVILQIMGSWCSNCMDETAFLSDYYNKHAKDGIEIIALGYEFSTDSSRSVRSLKKFQQQFKVGYTILNTGVTASDPERTAKTLPGLPPLTAFPTLVFLDNAYRVVEISSGFYGPGSGSFHQQYKTHFEETVKKMMVQ